MTMHMKSIWRDTRIQEFRLSSLTPMDLHRDERWKTRDLPRISSQGLWYPILLYKVTPAWWHGPFSRWRPDGSYYVDPIVNEDGLIWAVKVGSNRYQCALHLGYTSIDAIMFDHSDDCAKLGVWLRDCDPLNNENAPPYQGLYSYDNL